jgi:Domain of unknown function (DUF6268)
MRSTPWFSNRGSAVLGLLLVAGHAAASVDDIVQAIASSEIRFLETDNEVPFPALGWARYQWYSQAEFEKFSGGATPGSFQQQTASVGMVMPVHVGKRDLFMAGLTAGYDHFDFDNSSFADADVFALTPVVGWLRQLDEKSQVAAFVAPAFSTALGDNSRWGAHTFAGLLATYTATDRLMFIYGGVYENSVGANSFYPYLGLNWVPDKHWSIALVAPWPNISYALNTNCFVHLGVVPGGASWRMNNNGRDTVTSFGSWNITAGAAYRLTGHFWLHAEAGFTGLHSLRITSRGSSGLEADINSHPLITIGLEFRP